MDVAKRQGFGYGRRTTESCHVYYLSVESPKKKNSFRGEILLIDC
jgi:hypothetical protein